MNFVQSKKISNILSINWISSGGCLKIIKSFNLNTKTKVIKRCIQPIRLLRIVRKATGIYFIRLRDADIRIFECRNSKEVEDSI